MVRPADGDMFDEAAEGHEDALDEMRKQDFEDQQAEEEMEARALAGQESAPLADEIDRELPF